MSTAMRNENSHTVNARPFGSTARVLALCSAALVSLTGTSPVAADNEAPAVRPAGATLAPVTIVSRTRERPVLTLRPPRRGSRARTSTGNGWRHDLDIVLTADGDARVVHDESGRFHRFVPREPGTGATSSAIAEAPRFRAQAGTDGELLLVDGLHRWTRADGSRVTFAGSVPIRVSSPTGRVRELRYERGRLSSVYDTDRPTLLFLYRFDRLDELRLSDGTRWKIARDGAGNPIPLRDDTAVDCPASSAEPAPDTAASERVERSGDHPPDEPERSRCDTDSSPPDPAFERGVGIPGALRIDARPASCRSYFSDFAGTARGTAIETGIGDLAHYHGYTATVRSFPLADFVGGELRVVRSRDLSLPTYDAREDGLLERLLADGEEIERRLLEPLERHGELVLRELARTTTLVHEPGRPVVLELIVRHGLASGDQIRQIARARTLLRERHGIVLRVVEIP